MVVRNKRRSVPHETRSGPEGESETAVHIVMLSSGGPVGRFGSLSAGSSIATFRFAPLLVYGLVSTPSALQMEPRTFKCCISNRWVRYRSKRLLGSDAIAA